MSDTAATGRSADVRRMTFDDNALLPVLYGNHDRHLVRIEQRVGTVLRCERDTLVGAEMDAIAVDALEVGVTRQEP